MSGNRRSEKNHIKSLEKGLRLLLLLAQNDEGSSLSELKRQAGLSKTTCFRLLQTLRSLNFVDLDDISKRYRLGGQNISLGAAALRQIGLRRVALPFMKKLQEATNETVSLAVLEGAQIVIIERINAKFILNPGHRIGTRFPLHCTSLGKAVLAYLPHSDLQKVLKEIRFEAFTDKTILSLQDLKRELEEIRKSGTAVNNEELEKGLYAVASAIRQYRGDAIGSINVAFPLERHRNGKIFNRFKGLVKETCRDISAVLGFTGESSMGKSERE